MSEKFEKQTTDLLKARFPLLYIRSWEVLLIDGQFIREKRHYKN